MNDNCIMMTKPIDTEIRVAIQKMSVQIYYIEKYGYKNEDNHEIKKEEKLSKRAEQEMRKIREARDKAFEDIMKGSKQNNKQKNKKKKRKGEKFYDSHVPSIIRTFGAEFIEKNRKKIEEAKRAKAKREEERKEEAQKAKTNSTIISKKKKKEKDRLKEALERAKTAKPNSSKKTEKKKKGNNVGKKGKKTNHTYVKIIYVPFGGMNKRY